MTNEMAIILFKACDGAIKKNAPKVKSTDLIFDRDHFPSAVFDYIVRFPGCIDLFLDTKKVFKTESSAAIQQSIDLLSQIITAIKEKYKIVFGQTLIPWSWPENRPFLYIYRLLGLLYLEKKDYDNACKTFEEILALNPEDNQGVRHILPEIYLRLHLYDKIIELMKKYPSDGSAELMYGVSLALIKKGEYERARKLLKEAIQLYPLIAKLLLRKEQIKLTDEYAFIVVGGRVEAALYVKTYHKFWDEKALSILKEFEEDILKLVAEREKNQLFNEEDLLRDLTKRRK